MYFREIVGEMHLRYVAPLYFYFLDQPPALCATMEFLMACWLLKQPFEVARYQVNEQTHIWSSVVSSSPSENIQKSTAFQLKWLT